MATTETNPPLLHTVEETQRLMRWSRTKVSQMVAKGEIRSMRDGKRRLIEAASLHAYIDRKLKEAA